MDFVPNHAGAPKESSSRATSFWIKYGEDNRIQDFRTVNVTTRTDKPPTEKDIKSEDGSTAGESRSSKELAGDVSIRKTSDLSRLDPAERFQVRRRRSSCAGGSRDARNMDKDLMTLDKGARVWDSTGSAAADHIVTNQKTGDFKADGHVASTRMPRSKGRIERDAEHR